MKKMKWTALAGMMLAACFLLTGCLGDILYGVLSGMDTDASSLSPPLPPASSSSAPQADAGSAPQQSEKSEAPAQAPGGALKLDEKALALLWTANGSVKAANGTVCDTYIMYGGSPVVDYVGRDVALPYAFWLATDQQDMMAIWEVKSDGEGNAPSENFWPDDSPVVYLEAWAESVPRLFSTTGPVTYAMLEQSFGQAPELEFTAANEGVNYSYAVDTWNAGYEIDKYLLDVVFEKDGNDYVVYTVMLGYNS